MRASARGARAARLRIVAPTGTLLCGDLFTQLGDGPALTSGDVVGPACFGHYEADECGAMNEWLAAARHAEVMHGQTGALVSLNDMADRAPRVLADRDVVDLGRGKRARYIDTPHIPHGWDAGVLHEESDRNRGPVPLFKSQSRYEPLLFHPPSRKSCPPRNCGGSVAEDEEMVVGEPRRRRDLRHIGRNAIDAIRDLIDLGFDLTLPLVRSSSGASASLRPTPTCPLLDLRSARFSHACGQRNS
jgi:hypothetical protein